MRAPPRIRTFRYLLLSARVPWYSCAAENYGRVAKLYILANAEVGGNDNILGGRWCGCGIRTAVRNVVRNEIPLVREHGSYRCLILPARGRCSLVLLPARESFPGAGFG